MSFGYYEKIIKVLREMKHSHPKYNMGKHLSTSLDDVEFKHLWGMNDKELYNKLKEYQIALNMDIPHDESEVDKILKDGMRLASILDDDDDDDEQEYE